MTAKDPIAEALELLRPAPGGRRAVLRPNVRTIVVAYLARGPVSSVPSAAPSSISHERTPRHSPCVERPPGTPLIRRQGQIASQLHDSK